MHVSLFFQLICQTMHSATKALISSRNQNMPSTDITKAKQCGGHEHTRAKQASGMVGKTILTIFPIFCTDVNLPGCTWVITSA